MVSALNTRGHSACLGVDNSTRHGQRDSTGSILDTLASAPTAQDGTTILAYRSDQTTPTGSYTRGHDLSCSPSCTSNNTLLYSTRHIAPSQDSLAPRAPTHGHDTEQTSPTAGVGPFACCYPATAGHTPAGRCPNAQCQDGGTLHSF